jgi:transketolase
MRPESTTAECARLEERVFSVKKRFLAMYHKAHAGHIGSSLSCAEILVFLEFAWMREPDTFVLSKGHAAAALYSLLAEVGRLTPRQIDSFYAEGTQLSALPPFNAIEDIPFATGSLGYGLSVSAGMALGAKLDRADVEKQQRFFCVTSDGELNEGSVWEAALFIAHHKLSTVTWIIDRNQIQATGRTEDVLALEPLDAKLRAFGYHVIVADGHDFSSLLTARDECIRIVGSRSVPVAIVANTVKGNGVSFMRDTVECHYLPMNDAQCEQALDELTRAHVVAMHGYRLNGYRNED